MEGKELAVGRDMLGRQKGGVKEGYIVLGTYFLVLVSVMHAFFGRDLSACKMLLGLDISTCLCDCDSLASKQT